MDSIDISALTAEERLALIDRLWESLDRDALPVPPAQAAELARRLASADADMAGAIPWETLRAELAARSR